MPVGTVRKIWVDDDGARADRPQPLRAAVVEGILVGLAVAFALAVATALTVKWVKVIADRTRFRSWESEWQVVELDATN